MGKFPTYVSLNGDNFIVGKMLGTTQLGYYGMAYQLINMPADFFGQVIEIVFFPVLAKVQKNKNRLRTGFERGTIVLAFAVLPVNGVLFLKMSDTPDER